MKRAAFISAILFAFAIAGYCRESMPGYACGILSIDISARVNSKTVGALAAV